MGNRNHYTEEFKKDAVRLALSRGNRTLAEIAEGLGVSQSMLHRWPQKYGGTARAEAVSSQEQREDVEKLRRRLRELEQETATKSICQHNIVLSSKAGVTNPSVFRGRSFNSQETRSERELLEALYCA